MRRLGNFLAYFARTALRGLRTSPVATTVAAVTIGVSLVLVGSFALLLANMQRLLVRFGEDLRVTVYLEDALSADELAALAARVMELDEVGRVEVVSKEQALQRFRRGVGNGVALLEGVDVNPLPASLEVSLTADRRSPQGLRAVVVSIADMPGVADVASGNDWVEGYARALSLVRGLGTGLGGVLTLAAVLIVANTIRLAVLARRDELEILALVGAGRAFIRIPFLIEGTLQGAVGGALALAVLFALYRLLLPEVSQGLSLLIGSVEPDFFTLRQSLGLVAGGSALGFVGSAAALSAEMRS